MPMYKTFFGMEFNPFTKGLEPKHYFKSLDFTQATARLEHLKSIQGIGLFTGFAGIGKTYTLRCFANSLNPSLYKVVYIPLSTVSVIEFYKLLAHSLGLIPSPRKAEQFRNIQERIINLSKDKKITPVIILDEAQYLKTEVLTDIKLLFNFDMDSKNYATLILSGQPVLNHTLSMQVHEPLRQRIVINYNFSGISKAEVDLYISSRLKLAGVSTPIFNDNAIEALYSCSSGSVRKLNTTIEKCLLIAFQQSKSIVDTDIVMMSQNEIELI